MHGECTLGIHSNDIACFSVQIIFHAGFFSFRARNSRRSNDDRVGASEFYVFVFLGRNLMNFAEDGRTGAGNQNNNIFKTVVKAACSYFQSCRNMIIAELCHVIHDGFEFIIINHDSAVVLVGQFNDFNDTIDVLIIDRDEDSALGIFEIRLNLGRNPMTRCGMAFPGGTYGFTHQRQYPFIAKVGARIMSLANPEAKMSKSEDDDPGRVTLMDSPDTIMRLFKRAVTDCDACVRYDTEHKKGVSNLMTIYSAATGKTFPEIEREFDGKGYGDFKAAVGETVVDLLRPIREEATRLLADKAYLETVCKNGAEKASYIANKTLRKVYKKVGFVAK